MEKLIYRQSIIDKQGYLSGEKWVVLFPLPAHCYQTCHDFFQFGCGAARLQVTHKRPTDHNWYQHRLHQANANLLQVIVGYLPYRRVTTIKAVLRTTWHSSTVQKTNHLFTDVANIFYSVANTVAVETDLSWPRYNQANLAKQHERRKLGGGTVMMSC